jgi:hypothetical protein
VPSNRGWRCQVRAREEALGLRAARAGHAVGQQLPSAAIAAMSVGFPNVVGPWALQAARKRYGI